MINEIINRLEALEEHCLEMHDWRGQSVAVEAQEIVQEVANEYGNEYKKGKSDLSAEIMKYINSSNRNTADYFIVDQIEELCNKYIEQKGE